MPRGQFDQSDAPAASGLGLLPDVLPAEPWGLFKSWWDKAHADKVQPNPNAMVVATIDPDGKPSARVVLCKKFDLDNGHLVFFTNYESRKGGALNAHPRAALVLHWDTLDRQIRIEGPVVRSPAPESDEYFKSRPWVSRVGAWASEQSKPLNGRMEFLQKLNATAARFGINPDTLPGVDALVRVPRPEHWGGYRVHAERVELWCAVEGRLHDRAVWTRELKPGPTASGGDGPAFVGATGWSSTRLQP